MNANQQVYEVPLVELLERVPKDARFWVEEKHSSTHYPVGRLSHEAAEMLRQLQAENEALKAFVKPIIAHGDDCIGNWDELQDLAVKTGLLIEVEKTQFCNLDKEEFIGCPCREYHYDEESWVCLITAKFLLDEAQEK
jgi:hypothetical protein